MVASIPRIYSALNLFLHQFWSVSVVPKYLNFATPSKDLFAIFMPCLCPAFLRDTNIYLVFSEFTSKPTLRHCNILAFRLLYTNCTIYIPYCTILQNKFSLARGFVTKATSVPLHTSLPGIKPKYSR
jgi:hypothetical protein